MGAQRPRSGRGTAFSDGQWAKTNDSYHDEASVTQTWTITSTCTTYQDCTGTVTSDQGWSSANLVYMSGRWKVSHTVENWERCARRDGCPRRASLHVLEGLPRPFQDHRLGPDHRSERRVRIQQVAPRHDAVEAHPGWLKAPRGIVNGRSTELEQTRLRRNDIRDGVHDAHRRSRPWLPLRTSCPRCRPSCGREASRRAVQSMSGCASDHHAIAKVARKPCGQSGGDVGRQPGDVLDDDGLASVDDADRLHPQSRRTSRPRRCPWRLPASVRSRARSNVSRISCISTPRASATRRSCPCHSPAMAPGIADRGLVGPSGRPNPSAVAHDVGYAVVVVHARSQ